MKIATKTNVRTTQAAVQDGQGKAFSMAFEPSDNGVHLHMGWDKVRVAVPFTK